MISIAEAISDLLYVRDTVVVPGLGAFVKKAVSAKVNPVANYFAMPSSVLEFDPNLREDNDLVVKYISEKNDVPEDEARRLLAMFVSDCFNSLKEGKKVVLNQIGTLSYDWAGDLAFAPDNAVNYNADAFGLCDFTPEPVLRSKTKDEIKEEIERQQKDKNTPVTVDEKEVHRKEEGDPEDDDEPRRLGWLWIVLGILLVAGIVFGLHYFKVIDLGKFRIIAGCFDQEENAIRLVNSLKGKGYGSAFYEPHGKQWYVSFGRYATDEEAKTALREIRANTEYKAWILK